MHQDRIFENLKEEVDVIVIYNRGEPVVDLNFFYVTGLVAGGIFEGSYAIVTPENVKVLTSLLEETSAKKGKNEVYIFRTGKEREELLRKIVGDAKRIGLNFDTLTVRDFEKIKEVLGEREYINVSSAIMDARKVKSEEEINIMREAAKIASEVADSIPDFLHEGMREYELAAKIVYEMLRRGAEDVAFTTIAAFGENAAEPHYTAGARKLKRGDFVLCDFGARYHRYNSDITRTFVFGRASEMQKDIYYTVLEAQRMGIELIKAGVNGKEVDAKVHEFIDSTKYRGRMTHSTGHGLGLAVHDHVGLSRMLDVPLKDGMVVTVEPGIYIPGFGGVRIEDDVVVRKDGHEVLTSAKKEELIEVS
ncbi:Xaa-Pro aminopeptidase [Aciduliprofundum sp. MAR08-339]|uniref:M24 family metallopeptidase n=1 Tax=Aciduliprofundum sp. (strain MAR08-339) TaxID=673860 RepID=UPI0002A4B8EE|nr:Xaa-Pro aminopeptidase [Aciduliprofundum sp. MAR08-339]